LRVSTQLAKRKHYLEAVPWLRHAHVLGKHLLDVVVVELCEELDVVVACGPEVRHQIFKAACRCPLAERIITGTGNGLGSRGVARGRW
jgi:hypothetical protein